MLQMVIAAYPAGSCFAELTIHVVKRFKNQLLWVLLGAGSPLAAGPSKQSAELGG